MGTVNCDGVTFKAYSGDHEPMHVHAIFENGQVVIELRGSRAVLYTVRGKVSQRDEASAMRAAQDHIETLKAEWKKAH